MDKTRFSQNELQVMESLEVRGGTSAIAMAQFKCSNGAPGCGSGVDQTECTNMVSGCGSIIIVTQACQ